MKEAVGIRFKKAGKIYYFDPKHFDVSKDTKVVVETVRGIELGWVVKERMVLEDDNISKSLKPIVRLATDRDIEGHKHNIEEAAKHIPIIKEIVKDNQLDMKVVGCDYTLDHSKLIVYFISEGRIDFRELVKDLASEFRTRIELRQIGARDGAKLLGGLGPCGYALCCSTFLGDFDIVSIKMAKNQNLSLNPANISGACGKLLCCIRYENDAYTELKQTLPKVGSMVITKDYGKQKVISNNVLEQEIKINTEDGPVVLKVDQLEKIFEYEIKPKQTNG
jgi:cell fate regulator YaaT (PSP1 superfamily)